MQKQGLGPGASFAEAGYAPFPRESTSPGAGYSFLRADESLFSTCNFFSFLHFYGILDI